MHSNTSSEDFYSRFYDQLLESQNWPGFYLFKFIVKSESPHLEDLKSFFEGKKQLIMEFFYRNMRKKFDVLMDNGQPLGGQWNFDKNNRKKWKVG